jgi:hypothetical protein
MSPEGGHGITHLEYKCAALPLWIKVRTQNFNNYRIIDKHLSTFYFKTTQKML